MTLDQCNTVADLIGVWRHAHDTVPPKPTNGHDEERAYYELKLAESCRLEGLVADALTHYKCVVNWGRFLWYTQLPPRIGRVGLLKFVPADMLAWPPKPKQPPEKVAGFTMPQHYEKS